MFMNTLAESLALKVLAQSGKSFWLPQRTSEWAEQVDWTFRYIYYISLFFFLLIVALMIVFVVRYRRRPGQEALASPHHNLPLEILWTAVPIILVATIFWFGFSTFMSRAVVPQNAYEIRVIGQKWEWQFEYPNGYVDQDLHVPVDRTVELTMVSNDVIHSLFIPALRLKQDAVPGRYTKTWFEADVPGDYPILCAEYCGTGHSDMLARMVVHERGGFERWLEQASNLLATMSPVEAGQRLYLLKGCKQCHSLDGTANIGPTFKDLFGREVALVTGQTVEADENYIRQAIVNPQGQIVAGFDPVMPLVQLSEDEIGAMIAFLKSVSDLAGTEPTPAQGEPPADAEPAAATQPAQPPSQADPTETDAVSTGGAGTSERRSEIDRRSDAAAGGATDRG